MSVSCNSRVRKMQKYILNKCVSYMFYVDWELKRQKDSRVRVKTVRVGLQGKNFFRPFVYCLTPNHSPLGLHEVYTQCIIHF